MSQQDLAKGDWTVYTDPDTAFQSDGTFSGQVKFPRIKSMILRKEDIKVLEQKFAEIIQPLVDTYNTRLFNHMPYHTLGEKDRAYDDYTSKMKLEDRRHLRKYKNLKYHYTENKKSVRSRTKISIPYVKRKGKNKGRLAVTWKSTAPHYNWLRFGYGKNGHKVYEGAPWARAFEEGFYSRSWFVRDVQKYQFRKKMLAALTETMKGRYFMSTPQINQLINNFTGSDSSVTTKVTVKRR